MAAGFTLSLCPPLQAMVLSMLSASLPRNSQSQVSSLSPTRRCTPSALRNSCPSSMRTITPLSFSGTPCRQTTSRPTTSPSSRKLLPLTTCAWEEPAGVSLVLWAQFLLFSFAWGQHSEVSGLTPCAALRITPGGTWVVCMWYKG